MTKEEIKRYSDRIKILLDTEIAQVAESPLMANYQARNVKEYLQSLEILERMSSKIWQKD